MYSNSYRLNTVTLYMNPFQEIKESFLHLLFPHICKGCGTDNINGETELCMHCLASLPETNFEIHPSNPVEKIFWGRLPLISATSQFYFTKESLMQQLLHQFKYRGDRDLGLQLGRMMGYSLQKSGRFTVDALIPLPLFPEKEKRRGYNQATLLCEGIAAVMKIPVIPDMVVRPQYTETQTKKGRLERWKNMEGKFKLINNPSSDQLHVLLVDDVVTTGSTLEACGNALLSPGDLRISIATLCFASRQ
jgi:ComF family protein